VRLRPDPAGVNNEAEYYWLFPNLMLNVYPDNFSTNLILPLGPDRTVTIFEWFFRDPDPKTVDETVVYSDEIQIEDIAICEAVQKGLRSRTYDRGRYSVRRENGVHHFHALLSEWMGK
jgi:choline monooxygenase